MICVAEDGAFPYFPQNLSKSQKPLEKIMNRQIFISYRRDDSSYAAGRLYDRLSMRFGKDQIFMDIDTIELGVDFVQSIGEAVGACHVLIAIIGKKWVEISDATGFRRLDNPNDFVRLELVSALERDVYIIPALVDGSTMPLEDDLPEALKPLARRNGLQIGHTRFDSDVDRLIRGLEAIFDKLANQEAERIAREQEDERQAAIKKEAERIAKEQEKERQAAIQKEAERIAREQEAERQAAAKKEAEHLVSEVVDDKSGISEKLPLKSYGKFQLPIWAWFLVVLSILIVLGLFVSNLLDVQNIFQDKIQPTEPVIVAATTTPMKGNEKDPFVGTWQATDLNDRSNMVLTINKNNDIYEIHFIDEEATVCGTDLDGNLYAGEGNGFGVVNGNRLEISTTFICQNPAKSTESFDGYLIYNSGTNTLVDENNILWRR
jgi:hypothetical protein